MEAVEEIPIKIKKPRSEKQVEAFAKALAKKAELSLIKKENKNLFHHPLKVKAKRKRK